MNFSFREHQASALFAPSTLSLGSYHLYNFYATLQVKLSQDPTCSIVAVRIFSFFSASFHFVHDIIMSIWPLSRNRMTSQSSKDPAVSVTYIPDHFSSTAISVYVTEGSVHTFVADLDISITAFFLSLLLSVPSFSVILLQNQRYKNIFTFPTCRVVEALNNVSYLSLYASYCFLLSASFLSNQK